MTERRCSKISREIVERAVLIGHERTMLIIWQRFGVLVLVSGFVGVIGAKYLLAQFAGDQDVPVGAVYGLIGLVAFAANLFLFHLIFRPDYRELPNGDRVMVSNPDSMFFIPAGFYTWLFLLVAIAGGTHYGLEHFGVIEASERISSESIDPFEALAEDEDSEQLDPAKTVVSGTDGRPLIAMRPWTEAASGKHVLGEILAAGKGQCKVRGRNGKTFMVPINRFIESDQKLIRKAMQAAK